MQSFKQRYLMLFASPYSIENKDGTRNEGISAYFVMDDNLNPKVDEEAANRGQAIHGIKPTKMNLPYSIAGKVRTAPAFYDCEVKIVTKRVEQRGQTIEMPTMQIINVDFVSTVETKQGLNASDVKF